MHPIPKENHAFEKIAKTHKKKKYSVFRQSVMGKKRKEERVVDF